MKTNYVPKQSLLAPQSSTCVCCLPLLCGQVTGVRKDRNGQSL